jgi:hypothetical protein
MNPNSCLRPAALAMMLALWPAPGVTQDKPAAPQKAAIEKPAAAEQAKPVRLAKAPAAHPFVVMAGSWSGGGTLSLSSGTKERLRCRASYSPGQGGRSLALSIRCASDSYRFDLSSNVVDRRGRIFGRWSEASNGVSGSLSGHAAGGRVRALAKGDTFTAALSLVTRGNRQTVSITPHGAHITGVHIALSKR